MCSTAPESTANGGRAWTFTGGVSAYPHHYPYRDEQRLNRWRRRGV